MTPSSQQTPDIKPCCPLCKLPLLDEVTVESALAAHGKVLIPNACTSCEGIGYTCDAPTKPGHLSSCACYACKGTGQAPTEQQLYTDSGGVSESGDSVIPTEGDKTVTKPGPQETKQVMNDEQLRGLRADLVRYIAEDLVLDTKSPTSSDGTSERPVETSEDNHNTSPTEATEPKNLPQGEASESAESTRLSPDTSIPGNPCETHNIYGKCPEHPGPYDHLDVSDEPPTEAVTADGLGKLLAGLLVAMSTWSEEELVDHPTFAEAHAAITTLMDTKFDRALGEDEKTLDGFRQMQDRVNRNQLRAETRTRWYSDRQKGETDNG